MGIQNSLNKKKDNNLPKILDILTDFRSEIRNRALEKDNRDIETLKACDRVRSSLQICGVELKVKFKINYLSSIKLQNFM